MYQELYGYPALTPAIKAAESSASTRRSSITSTRPPRAARSTPIRTRPDQAATRRGEIAAIVAGRRRAHSGRERSRKLRSRARDAGQRASRAGEGMQMRRQHVAVAIATFIATPACTRSGAEPGDGSADDAGIDSYVNPYAGARTRAPGDNVVHTYAPTYSAVWNEILLRRLRARVLSAAASAGLPPALEARPSASSRS